MKKTIALIVTLFMVCAFSVQGQSPTWYNNVNSILQNNCIVCHQQNGANLGGMVAPMSFSTYKEARPWAKAIGRVVKQGIMPPWHASEAQNGRFRNERRLSDTDRDTLVRWARYGAKRGSPANALDAVIVNGLRKKTPAPKWTIGTPDLKLTMPEPYLVKDNVRDLYRNFSVKIPENVLTEERWIRAVEFKPGSTVVHHIIGYTSKENINVESGLNFRERFMVGGIAPGNDPDEYPEGYGAIIKPGAVFTFAMHYHKEAGPGTAIWDQSSVGLKFYPKGVVPIQIHTDAIGQRDQAKLIIKPGLKDQAFSFSRTLTKDTTILNYLPHMHLRGQAAKYMAIFPDGREEILLEVPKYDFNWQTTYWLKEPVTFPIGTVLTSIMIFDNTKERAAIAGFDSTRQVRFGGPTTDEMALGWITYSETESEIID